MSELSLTDTQIHSCRLSMVKSNGQIYLGAPCIVVLNLPTVEYRIIAIKPVLV